jgi:hypothetical protein
MTGKVCVTDGAAGALSDVRHAVATVWGTRRAREGNSKPSSRQQQHFVTSWCLTVMSASSPPHASCMLCPSHPPRLHHSNYPKPFVIFRNRIIFRVSCKPHVQLSSRMTAYSILWRIDPLLGNDSVNTFPREPTRAKIGCPLLGNGSVSTSP